MKGFPKTINTRQDLDNLLAMPEHRAAAEAKLWQITMNRFMWVPEKVVASEKDGKISATSKLVTSEDEQGRPVILQMKLVEDEKSQYFRLFESD